ncbi:MAG: hypothetical protein F6K42_36415 [Leptolyngbya sp. SIO1D8]|nr:hypothetical protein [Leptolyngbya sp. SIO1D8]
MAQLKDDTTTVASVSKPSSPDAKSDVKTETTSTSLMDGQAIDDTFAALKTLLNTVEKLQKARQNVGDIKPLLIRLLDGEMLSGDELDQVKTGVGGLGKLVKLYSDYQDALTGAQPARQLLDDILKTPQKNES